MAEEQASRLIELSKLPPTALIAIDDLAQLLNRDDGSIRKAIKRGELPQPFPLCSKRYWRVDQLLKFFHCRAAQIEHLPLPDDEPSRLPPRVPQRRAQEKVYRSTLRKER